jgi:hypothetical protein
VWENIIVLSLQEEIRHSRIDFIDFCRGGGMVNKFAILLFIFFCRGGGMVDAQDLKSCDLLVVRVRVPLTAQRSCWLFAFSR